MVWLAFRSALREILLDHADRKITHLLLGLSLLAAGVLATLAFDVATPEETVDDVARAVAYVGNYQGMPGILRLPLEPSVESGRVVRGKDGTERWEFTLRFPGEQAIAVSRQNWEESLHGREPWRMGRSRSTVRNLEIPSLDAQKRWLAERFGSLGFHRVSVSRQEGADPVFDVSITPRDPFSCLHVRSVRVAGGFTFRLHGVFSCADVVITIQKWLMDGVAGLFGVSLALILVGLGFFRSLEKGAVEPLLARPVPRAALFLTRVAAAGTVVTAHAAVLVLATATALWWRTGFWNPGFLAGIPLTGFLFATLFSVSALVSVIGRSAALAPVAGLGVWMISAQVDSIYRVGLSVLAREITPFWEGATRVLYWTFPKTAALKERAVSLLARDGMSPEVVERLGLSAAGTLSWGWAAGTTLLFAAFFLGLATWRFARKEP